MMKLRTHIAVWGLYLLVAIAITWPLAAQLGTRLAGFGYSDAYEMAHHLWWFQYAIENGEPLFEQPLLAYPDGIEGITLWANPLQFFPAWAFALVVPVPVAYNVTLLLTMALNGWAMFVLARHLTRSDAAALLAGVLYLAFPTMQGHLGAGHAGLLVQWPLPLFVLALLRLRETTTGSGRPVLWLLLAALLFMMTAFGHTLQLLYATLPVVLVFLAWLALARDWRAFAYTVAACALGTVALALYLYPVAAATLGTAAYADAGGAVRYSADLLAPLTPSFMHPLFGQLEYTHRVLGINIDEGYAYVGIVAGLLALVALVRRPAARLWGGLALLVYLLSLGPLLKILDQPVRVTIAGIESFVPLPAALFDTLPVLNLARTPGRFSFVLALAVAVLAAYGFSVLWGRLGRSRWGVMAVLAAFALFEYQAFWPLPLTSAEVPAEIAALRDADDVRAVFDIPWDNLVTAKQGLFLQTIHEQALIAGHVTRSTPVDPAKLTLLQSTLSRSLLSDAGADIVIVHREQDADSVLYDRAEERLGEPLYRDDDYAVFRVPPPGPAVEVIKQVAEPSAISDAADSFVWTFEPGWMLLDAELEAEGRTAVVTLDGEELLRQTIDGEASLTVPVPLMPGYHTLRLAVDPPCPQVYSEALRCQTLDLRALSLDGFLPDTFEPVAYGNGVTLAAGHVALGDGESLPVWLWWQFSARRSENDIRFVHMVNETGTLVAQADGTLGNRAIGEGHAEVVTLALPDNLPTGTYRVFAGWYTYPDAVRFPVLSDVRGAESGYALVGEYVVR
jgi:hypothetical protein